MSKVRSRLTFANVVSCLALFVALGGSAYALGAGSVGTAQLKDQAVTSSKLATGAVTTGKLAAGAVTTGKLANNAVTTGKLANNAETTGKLANNAVTTGKLANNAVTTGKLANNAVTTGQLADNSVNSAKVADGSLTATDIAPNTFLAANGTAADSSKLGGLLPSDFVQGVGFKQERRVVVSQNGSSQILSTLFGTFTGNCGSTGKMNVTWSPTVANAEYLAQIVEFGGTTSIDTANGIPAGGAITDPATSSAVPLAITFQIGFTSSGLDHVATAFITGRFESGTGCVFIGQELSTG